MKTFYRRNLPHYQPGSGIYFITYRLANSLPVKVAEQLKEDYLLYHKMLQKSTLPSEEIERLLDVKFKRDFALIDKHLNSGEYGEKWLQNEQVAEENFKALLGLSSATEKVISFCIMPNHVHLLLHVSQKNIDQFNKLNHDHPSKSKTAEFFLSDVLRKLKGSTARVSNLVLNRSGSFWHHESYDRFVRDEKELTRILLYILNNPVKADLCKQWMDWKWTYLNPEYRSLIEMYRNF